MFLKMKMFSCPEEFCKRTFMKYGNLLKHLDIGKHSKPKMTQNLSDRTKVLYSIQIENKVVKYTYVNALTVDSTDTSKFPKGWALKLKRELKKFTQSQKNFMTDKFEIGERSGQKCDPDDVSTLMRSVKDEHGRRLFKPVEFLSTSQIASFFSRLALKKRKTSLQEYSEEDQDAENDAVNFRHLTDLANV
ncbi:unnamed protein product [Mytilus coruscus]|uniref:C2H2-type domain-containing protein n=1 Tax=Mytilus coruscus TaxID=42192 RepID=A0A6J8A4P4_MYTCO|nr:unnamed protein product [Mytilus coruscus]